MLTPPMTLHSRLIELSQHLQNSPLQRIDDAHFAARGVELWLKRDDLLHPIISGNKWRKLKYSLNAALNQGADTLVSMGGAYSNHLHALAYVGKCLSINTLGLIRGQLTPLTPSLRDMQTWGMQLTYIDRSRYRDLRYQAPPLSAGQYWLAEGGAHWLALQGIAELVAELATTYDYICLPCGTGTTLAGICAAAPARTRVLGIAAVKNNGFLERDINGLLPENAAPYVLHNGYAWGGFAKTSPQLMAFIAKFHALHGVELEPVYTGKLLFALYDLLEKGYFSKGQRLLAVHTGGLQGKRGFIY